MSAIDDTGDPTAGAFRDLPLSHPPTGNPVVFGPGRGRGDERAAHAVYTLCVAYLLWWVRPYDDPVLPPPGALTGPDIAFALLATLLIGAAVVFQFHYPLHRMIVRVDDAGVTLRSLGRFHDRERSFVPFDRLESVTVEADRKVPPWNVLRIDLRGGPGWLHWQFAARTATGTEAAEIAGEIARRATAAGLAVTRTEGGRTNRGRTVWTFTPDDAGRD